MMGLPTALQRSLLLIGLAALLVSTVAPLPGARAAGELAPPRNVSALASATESAAIEVSWDAPAADPLPVGYNVLPQRQGEDGTWSNVTDAAFSVQSAVPQVIEDLVNGTTYRVRVRAVYADGGTAEATSGAAVPYGTPGAPSNVSALPGDGGATGSRAAAASNGRTITAYTVTASPALEEPVEVSGTTTSVTVQGLTNETDYTFRVRATNLRGAGPLSTPSAAVEPTAADDSPDESDGDGPGGGAGDGGLPDDGVGDPDASDDGDSPEGVGSDDDPASDDQATGEEDEQGPSGEDDEPTDGADESTEGAEPGDGDGAPADAPAFNDVSPGSTHAENIATLVEAGITQGCGDGDGFCPGDPVTRGQMASFLARAYALPEGADAQFQDVPPGGTHAGAIDAIAAAGITQGCREGFYCPTEHVVRGQMATFLARAGDLSPSGMPLPFADVPDDHPHRDGIDAVYTVDITRGCDDGSNFCPGEPVTREQMASFLVRALGL